MDYEITKFRTMEKERFTMLRNLGKAIQTESERALKLLSEAETDIGEHTKNIEKIGKSLSVIRGISDGITNTMSRDIPMWLEKKSPDSAEKLMGNMFGYKCFFEAGSIELSIPMLPGKGIRYIPGKHFYDYNSKLGEPVEAVMRYRKTDENFKPDQYSFKTLYFLFVYNTQSKNVLDSDNHDTKNVQDAVCGFFKTGDSGNTCRTVFTTEITDLIPQATYICVTPMSSPMRENKEIIAYWRGKIMAEKRQNMCSKSAII